MGLMGFGFTIIFFSFFADIVGYGKLMVIAFLLHVSSVAGDAGCSPRFERRTGKTGAYWCLYIGSCCFSLWATAPARRLSIR